MLYMKRFSVDGYVHSTNNYHKTPNHEHLGDVVHDCTSCNSTQGRVIVMNKLSCAKVKKAFIPYIAFALAPILSIHASFNGEI
jgi:hypothetical protein